MKLFLLLILLLLYLLCLLLLTKLVDQHGLVIDTVPTGNANHLLSGLHLAVIDLTQRLVDGTLLLGCAFEDVICLIIITICLLF